MERVRLATLFRGNDARDALAAMPVRPLTIKDEPVRFLLDTLQQQTNFQVVMTNVGEPIWQLDFFINSPFRQTIIISFAEANGEDLTIHCYESLREQCLQLVDPLLQQTKPLSKGVFAQIREAPTEQQMKLVSLLVRDTKSLTLANLTEHSDRYLHVDGRGCVTISHKAYHQVTFEQQLVLLALAKAYLLAMNMIMNQLADCCEDIVPLKVLYKDAITFNARFFFAFPVKVNRYSTFQHWEAIRQSMAIEAINEEVIQQLQSIHQILTEEESAQQLTQELRLNKRLGWLGVAIGVLSLVSLFEITPEKIIEFVQSWIELLGG